MAIQEPTTQEPTTQRQPDHYTWLVEYADGTLLAEYDDERPDGRGWLEVEQERVTTVFLLNPDPAVAVTHLVLVPQDAAPVFLRRRLIQFSPEGEIARATVHCIGWHAGEAGVYLFVFADGSSLVSSDIQAI